MTDRESSYLWWPLEFAAAIVFVFLLSLIIVTVNGTDRREAECMDPKIHLRLVAGYEYTEAWNIAYLECNA